MSGSDRYLLTGAELAELERRLIGVIRPLVSPTYRWSPRGLRRHRST